MERQYRGYWWLPDKPEKKIHGTLTMSTSDRTLLELDDSLSEVQPFKPSRFAPKIILGQSMQGVRLTLLDCIQIDVSFGLATGLKTQTLLVQMVLVGVSFERIEDVKFKSVSVEFSAIDQWIPLNAFEVKHEGQTTAITYTRPSPIEVIIDGAKLTVEFQAFPRYDFPKEVCITQKIFLAIETNSEEPFEVFEHLIFHLQNLITLGLEQAISPLSIVAFNPRVAIEIQGQRVSTPIEVAFRYRRSEGTLESVKPFFDFRDIQEHFQTVVKTWFEKESLLEPVSVGYFGPFYSPRMYLEQKFLGYTQALESYHQRVFDGYGIPPDAYSKITPAVMTVVPTEHSDWFHSKLDYNEPSLRQRLKALLSKAGWIDLGGNAFVDKVVKTRNYNTHHDEELKDEAASGEQLILLTLKLQLLIKIALLREIGLEDGKIETIIKRSDSYHHIFDVHP